MQKYISTITGSALLGASLLLSLVCITSYRQQLTNTYDSILALAPHTQLAQVSGSGSGLVAHYTFDEGSGTTAGDSAGSNTGTLTNGPVWVAGKVGGGALQFDGSDDNIQLSPSSLNTNIQTISFWVNPIAGFSGTIYRVSNSSANSTYRSKYEVRITSSGITFITADGAAADSDVFSTSIPSDSWSHVVCMLDDANMKSCFLNGDQISLVTNDVDVSLNIPTAAFIGTNRNLATNNFFEGTLDDLRIYSRALSPSEVSDLYNLAGEDPDPTPTPVSGSCGSTNNSCTTGSLNDTADTSTDYQWQCEGSNGGSTASCSLPIPSTPGDTTPPTISSIQSSSITTTGATITWTTNEASDTQIEYGLTTSYGNTTTLNTSLVTSHTQSLTGLTSNTLYNYRVRSKDAAGNQAQSSNQTFTTSGSVTPPVSGSHIYIGQSQVGTGDASSCSNAKAVSFFNTATNWGTGSSQIGPGKTVHLCGTISTALILRGSGTPGNPITVLFEPGAKMSAPTWPTPAAIYIPTRSYVVIDGGSDGIIEATASGTNFPLASGVQRAVRSEGGTNVEIKNLTIRNLYLRTPLSDDPTDQGFGMSLAGTSNLSVHDNFLTEMRTGIVASGPASNISIYSNRLTRISNGMFVSAGGNSSSLINGLKIYRNTILDGYVWDGILTNGHWFHNDGIQISAPISGSYVDNVEVYGNTIGGDMGTHITAFIYMEDDIRNTKVYNNLLYSVGTSWPVNGFIVSGIPAWIYGNTIVANAGGSGIQARGAESKVVGNLMVGVSYGVSTDNADKVGTSDYNLYYFWKDPVMGVRPYIYTYAKWKSDLGLDLHSTVITAAQVNSVFVDKTNFDFRLKAGSPAIDAVQDSAMAALLNGLSLTDSSGNPVDFGGASRPQGTTWDIGAYEYTGTVTPPSTYTITATKAGTGQGTLTGTGLSCTGTTCTASVANSSSVTLSATPSTGSTFTGWSNGCTGTSTCTLSSAASVTATFTLVPDTTAPTVSLTSPSGTISGSVTLSATASDNVGVGSVQFLIDGSPISTLTTAPYSGSWNTVGITDGTHTLTAIARDAAGNSRTSNPVTVTINNNTAPVLSSIGAKSVTTGTPLTFTVAATDAQNNTLTYVASNLPTGATFANRVFTWTPSSVGTYTTRFTVSDGTLSDFEDVVITVSAPLPVDQDSDGDGVANAQDRCPLTPLSLRNEVNIYGCPKPKVTKFTVIPDPSTTDISTSLSSLELSNAYGKVTYQTPVVLYRDQTTYKGQLDIDTNMNITSNAISLASASLPELNRGATVTLYNVTHRTPRIMKDGVLCTTCTFVSYSNNTYVFRVTGFSSYTVEETPDTTTTTTAGGGGGGGGSSVTTSQTGNFTPTVPQISSSYSTSTPSVSPYAGLSQLLRNLYRGITGEDVRTLQRFLVIEGLLTIDMPTTYFGILTETAVKAFQAKNSIVSTGDPYTTGYGSVGPKTRSVINAKIGTTTPVPPVSQPSVFTPITTTLSYDMTDPQVITLQTYLISKGYLTSQATGYFGSLTEAAVKKLQCERLSVCSGTADTTGWGVVGPRTRALLQ